MRKRADSRPRVESARLTASGWALVSVMLVFALAPPLTASAQPEHAAAHHSFREVSTGRAIPTGGAVEASFHSYESEDGIVVIQLREWYKSPADAQRGLTTLTKHASRLIKQGTKKDSKGRVIGNRVELVFSHGHRVSPEMVIAWADGDTVVRLSSTSLPLLLDFENQYYP
jgi:hypothetical protein